MTLLRTLLGQSLRPSELDTVLDSDSARLADAIVEAAVAWRADYSTGMGRDYRDAYPTDAVLLAAVDAAKEATHMEREPTPASGDCAECGHPLHRVPEGGGWDCMDYRCTCPGWRAPVRP